MTWTTTASASTAGEGRYRRVRKVMIGPVERLVLRSLTFVTDTEVDLVLDGDDGDSQTWRFRVDDRDGIVVTSGPPDFNGRYRQMPGPTIELWPEQLVAAAYRARLAGLPAGSALDALIASARAAVRE